MNKPRLLTTKINKEFIFAALLIVFLTVLALPQGRETNAPTSSAISENALRAHIKFLSDNLLEGRGPGARGGEIAAKYIAAQLEALGLKGAGAGGSFVQPVSLVGVKADPTTVLTVKNGARQETFKFADEFVAFTGAQTDNVSVSADLVFVGYGIDAPNQRWNDYKGAAEDYRGKILVMLVNDPPATTAEPDLFGGRALTYYGRWTYKFEEAARRGAAGAILLHTDESAGYGWSVVRTSNGSWRFDIARGANDQSPFLQVRSWMTDDAAKRMMTFAGQDLTQLRRAAASRDFKPVKLNLQAAIALRSEVQRIQSSNVAAVIPGRDARLRDEYVIYTGHWDHLGIGAPNAKGDSIYNGAVDNSSGIATILGIASAMMRLPESERPRRSVMFLFTTAEEQGLLGAEWYARNPLVPLAKTAANVNLDSMNILGRTTDFSMLGSERSTLGAIVDRVARERNMTVKPDPRPEQGSFFRSDHFPFAKVGVPALSMGSGTDFVGRPSGWGAEQFRAYNSANYHQPSDEYNENWNLQGMVQQAELALAIGRIIADGDEMPRYNPNDEFARARER
ncbi:MAG: M28 family peptidase [Pyrinomonadaceae bacterium]